MTVIEIIILELVSILSCVIHIWFTRWPGFNPLLPSRFSSSLLYGALPRPVIQAELYTSYSHFDIATIILFQTTAVPTHISTLFSFSFTHFMTFFLRQTQLLRWYKTTNIQAKAVNCHILETAHVRTLINAEDISSIHIQITATSRVTSCKSQPS